MKKTLLVVSLLFAFLSNAQEKQVYLQDVDKKHEVKINALMLISAEWIDVSYEYLIDSESSFGSSFTVDLTNNTTLDYAITPYYRRYFSGKFARGFFVEGFGSLFSAESGSIFDDSRDNPSETGFALGIAVGGKFVTSGGFTTELLYGVGRNVANGNADVLESNEFFPRVGISVGYRF